jgi:hypothetical protein
MGMPPYLNLKEEVWNDFLRQSISEQTHPLALAFDSGFLREQDYIQTVKTKNDLPNQFPWLKADFFQKEPDFEILKQYKVKVCKLHGLLPIGRWEDKNYFARIFPATIDTQGAEFEATLLEPVFMLAPWSAMKIWFKKNGRNEQIKTKCLSESRKSVTPMKF